MSYNWWNSPAPVGETCPLIDTVKYLLDYYKRSNEDETMTEDIDLVLKTLEEIRSANEQLRKWGLDLHKELEDTKQDLDAALGRVSSLESDIQYCQNQLA